MDRYDNIKKQIQQNIKGQRKRKKITQYELSKRLNKSRFWVTAIERGNIIPTVIGIYQIADTLRCSIFDILPTNFNININNPNIDSMTAVQVISLLDETHKEIQNEVI
jgi:transcriptional regulator with XRE-family HTH domain